MKGKNAMVPQFAVGQIVLWLFVVVSGIVIGGGLYEQLVVMPLWSMTPPDSVVAYHQHNVAFPQFALNPGGRFWMLFMPSAGLLAIAAFISGLRTRPEHRKWRMAATILALLVVVVTVAWFVPNIIVLEQGGTGLDAVQLTSLTNWWVRLNWVRAVLFVAAWLMAIRALTIPAGRETEI